MSKRSSSSSIFLLSLLGFAQAVSVPFTKVPAPGAQDVQVLASSKDASDPFQFDNLNDVVNSDIYVATVSVAGKDYVVQLDTGSSDLWLDTTGQSLSSLTNTGLQTGVVYGDGTSAAGPVLIGPVKFGDATVNSAFISAPGSNATTNGDKGLLGVGPPSLSAIKQQLATTTFDGDTVLENIFQANTSEQQFITFQLSRSLTTGNTDGGVFTIGEVNSTLSTVSSEPKLNVISKDRWVVLMDGIIVNGQNFSGQSSFSGVAGQTSGQTLANLDTGTSLAQIPQAYVDAIYSTIPGAQFVASQGVYLVPCNANINVSFVFGGVEYPIHPIDTVTATLDTNNDVACFSGFPSSGGTDTDEDLLLGDTFLRNVYSLFDFGSFITGNTNTPFIQLLSTTNKDQAFAEFDSLSAQRNASLTNKNAKNGPSGSGGSTNGASVVIPQSFHVALGSLLALCMGVLQVL